MLRVGQRVECIDDEYPGWEAYWSPHRPVKGGIYTVRWSGLFWFKFDVRPAVRLVGIVNPVYAFDDGDTTEIAFGSRRFRPIVEKQTDISFAHEILRKATKRERV